MIKVTNRSELHICEDYAQLSVSFICSNFSVKFAYHISHPRCEGYGDCAQHSHVRRLQTTVRFERYEQLSEYSNKYMSDCPLVSLLLATLMENLHIRTFCRHRDKVNAIVKEKIAVCSTYFMPPFDSFPAKTSPSILDGRLYGQGTSY